MRSWPAPDVPRLPAPAGGRRELPRVFDTATQTAVEPLDGRPTARLYVCGITPYDATHMGHAATYLAFDLLVRAWRDAGVAVSYVQNVTDVDDPLLERAERDGDDWRELAAREVDRFAGDMAALRILPPEHYVGVVESLPRILALMNRLRERGAVYDVDGDAYFPIAADPAFGSVSHLPAAAMRELFAERGGDPGRPGKKDPLDSLLWRAERPGEPAWDSPFGRGRPGWHVECSAIALDLLGEQIDVQGGGNDLVFPHHETCAAQARVVSGTEFARAYVHAGMVAYQGEKMSKSLGNLVFVSTLRDDGVDPMAIRLALLAHHYRSDWEWTSDDLDDARRRLARWRAAATLPAARSADAMLAAVRSRLADDLDAPGALAAVDRWVEVAQREGDGNGGDGAGKGAGGDDRDGPALMAATVDALLGVAL